MTAKIRQMSPGKNLISLKCIISHHDIPALPNGLVDNTTFTDRYFTGEPGLSFLLETAGKKILFDTGYSDVFLSNAQKMGISVKDLDYLVFSHGHLDHTGGLGALIRYLTEARINRIPFRVPLGYCPSTLLPTPAKTTSSQYRLSCG